MKRIFPFLLCASFVFAQNSEERQKIVSKTNPYKKIELTDKIALEAKKNADEIQAYLLQFPNTPNPQNIQFIWDGKPVYYSPDYNADSVATLRANSMYPGGVLGLNVTGSGMTVGVWDSEKVRTTHNELTGRVTAMDNATVLNTHATHVTGTIIATGAVNLNRRGFAYQAQARTYDFSGDIGEMNGFAGEGFLVSNHSYGLVASNLSNYMFGQYTSQSYSTDEVLYNYPYYQIVKSAGNDRGTTTLSQVQQKQGYDLLTGMSCAKNVLTVAAVEVDLDYTGPESVIMATFSNYGPTDDGRIKPDIAAMGVMVNSCISTSDAAYGFLSGTSMSSPAITGLITLLQKHYSNLNNGNFMLSSSVRTLLCQSAREAGGNNGPDYEFGWGLADGYAAAQIISGNNSNAILNEITLNNGQTFTRTFTINSTQDLNVAIGWTDPAGQVNSGSTPDVRTPRLVNNLDLKIIKDGTTYYPWKMNPDDVYAAPTNDSDNDVDNIERINIYGATPGVYTIQVTHKGTLTGGSQDFSLVASGSAGLNLATQNFESDNTFFVYPNPATTEIHFNNPKELTLNSVNIYDITGKLVAQSSSIVNNTVDVSALQSGMYMVKISSENGIFVRKFSKK
ncbi:S8 family peptidase [Flavobacterium sp. N1719]|uniref:S8 family peptidase n=1 Tax=Flavobacterium sp. N1719 TaxID=2885633 RepID=UPI00222319A7|nr:S8 family peptidase [Flavobacterium sp. N1719]